MGVLLSVIGAFLFSWEAHEAAGLRARRRGRRRSRSDCAFFVVPLISALVNPLFNHNGMTVLFFLNGKPFTLEALFYGVSIGLALSAVLLWCRTFTHIMTSDKLLYITGGFSPKMALMISIALRYIPLYRRQAVRTREAQRAIGLVREENPVDRIKGAMRVFSGMVTWALENGIITADSMEARGFGTGRRTQLRRFGFRKGDILFIAVTLVLMIITASAVGTGSLGIEFYPSIAMKKPNMLGTAGIISYGVLILLPIITETEASLRWRSLRSGI